MKKSTLFLSVSLATALFIAGCGSSSVESDAKKVADLQCRAQKLAAKAMTGDTTILAESQKITEEANKLNEELKNKYTNPLDMAKFAQAYAEAIKDCK